MTMLPLRLPIMTPTQGMMSGPSAPALELQIIGGNRAHNGPEELRLWEEPLDTAETPATSKRQGSFYFDWEQGQYLEWDDLADFKAWCQEEELAYTIEIISLSTYHGGLMSL
jgi:hypothetical protein